MPDPRDLLIEDVSVARQLLENARRVAVLGIRSHACSHRPAHYVPRYLAGAGFDILPVPVYEPEVHEILGRPVYRRVADVPPPIDMVVVFRRSPDIPAHVDDLIAARPGCVWFQLGIRNEEAAMQLAEAGIPVVQDRCTMIEHRRAVRRKAMESGSGG